MTKQRFLNGLSILHLTPSEAARLLSVTSRTIYRWLEHPQEIPGVVIEVLRAWSVLKKHNLPWRPDCMPLNYDMDARKIAQQIALYYGQLLNVGGIIQKVKERGSLGLQWQIDMDAGSAKLEGTIEVTFCIPYSKYILPLGYRRMDTQPTDKKRNEYLIEDAIFEIYQKVCVSNQTIFAK